MGIELEGIHLLFTYMCDRECDHCFVWSSPRATATMTLSNVRTILDQAAELGTVRSIYFEGGEPFLYFPVMLEAVREARARGFDVGVVTNGYWGTCEDDGRIWVRHLKGLGIKDFSVSDDELHRSDDGDERAKVASSAAKSEGLPLYSLEICAPREEETEADLMFRGRAARELSKSHRKRHWSTLTDCPEKLEAPSRVHIDPHGYVHICQGLTVGNMRRCSLSEMVGAYDPAQHPIASALVDGGPAELVRRFKLPHRRRYADSCELCYDAREMLRPRFPELLAPDEMYGVCDSTPSEKKREKSRR